MMKNRAMTVRKGEGETLSVLGAELRFLCSAASTDHRFSLMEVVLPKDQGPPPHDHPWDEVYYVLGGEVWFLVGDHEAIYKAGDFLYAPGGVVHSFKGAGERPARVLVFDAPATAEHFFREVDERGKSSALDAASIREIGLRHDLNFHPPA